MAKELKEELKESSWSQMMDYCKKYELSPAQNWAWKKARNVVKLHDKKTK